MARPTETADQERVLLDLERGWPLVLTVAGGVVIAIAGTFFVFGARRAGGVLLRYGLAAVVAGIVIDAVGLAGADWRARLPEYIDPDIVVYTLGAIGLLAALNLLRHFLALFVGYGAANSTIGNLLSTAIVSVFTMIFWPIRALRRLGRGSRQPLDDI